MKLINYVMFVSLSWVSLSSFAFEDGSSDWRELDIGNAESLSVLVGAAEELATIEKSGQLIFEKVEKKHLGGTTDLFRMTGLVLKNDGLVENDFMLAITRVMPQEGDNVDTAFGVLYQEKRTR